MPDNENKVMHDDMQMEDSGMMPDHIHHEKLLRALHDCEETCEHMATHLLRRTDVQQRSKQLELLRDCADVCTFTGKYVARLSNFSRYAANLCAYVCVTCGNECLKFTDRESQECGRICHHCARECKAFSMM